MNITAADVGRYMRRRGMPDMIGHVEQDPGNGWVHPSFCYEWKHISDELEFVTITPERAGLPTGDACQLVAARQITHGDFRRTGGIAHRLKTCLADEIVQAGLPSRIAPDQREALDMILAKIARIISGDPNHADHWRDISGYSQLVLNMIEGSGCPNK